MFCISCVRREPVYISTLENQPTGLPLRFLIHAFILISLLTIPTALIAAEEIIYVKQNAEGGEGNGASWENAYSDLQDALALAKDNPDTNYEIRVAAGTYKPATYSDISSRKKSFILHKNVKLYGGFAGTEANREQRDFNKNKTTLSGNIDDNPDSNANNSYHVVTCVDGGDTALLDGFAISCGNADGGTNSAVEDLSRGGGMYNQNSSPVVKNCTFRDNTAIDSAIKAYGGGMYNKDSNPSIENCAFIDNAAIAPSFRAYGGAIYNENSNPTVRCCTFECNKATGSDLAYGGGIYNKNSSPEVENCTFEENAATATDKNPKAYGGGIYNLNSDPTVKNCTFKGNIATGLYAFGGGICNNNGSLIMTNCTLTGNKANEGGGIYNDEANLTVINCTAADNEADQGGGMYNYAHAKDIKPIVTNCIFWGNKNGQIVNKGRDAFKATPFIHNCVVENGEVGGTPDIVALILQDPMIAPLAYNGGPTSTHALRPGSSAIESGLPVGEHTIGGVVITVPDKDQRGRDRPQNPGKVDIGAFQKTTDDLDPTPNPEPTPEPGPTPAPDPTPNPEPTPEPGPTPVPDPTPPPEPAPISMQPIEPPMLPPGMSLPEGSQPVKPEPLTISPLPPDPTPEQVTEALREALRRVLFPEELINDIIGYLYMDDAGQIHITREGIDRLCEVLGELVDIPEGAENAPLPVFRALLGLDKKRLAASSDAFTAVIYFNIPGSFIGEKADTLQLIKMLGSESARPFKHVHRLEELTDCCVAVVEVEEGTLERVLLPDDKIDANSRLAFAIRDGGPFDLDGKKDGGVSDPSFIIEGKQKATSNDPGGGCTTQGFAPALLILLTPPALLTKRK